MAADIDCVILGAGVIGLAIARELAQAGREVLVVETAQMIGTGTSSRNSEVIHAGIYYPQHSLKAKFCIAGKKQLYAYCAQRNVPHRQLGKLIVAKDAGQSLKLDRIADQARLNGVDDLVKISGAQARELEPALACAAALLSPSTGIIDSHALMLALQGDAENSGAQFVFQTPFAGGRILGEGGFALSFGGAEAIELTASCVINATGLYAPEVAHKLAGLPARYIPKPYFCKGSYFTLTGKSPFSRLIYPLPNRAGLGVHLTLDMAGQTKFGPDTQWLDSPDYTIDPHRSDAFYAEVRDYWPELPDHSLSPGYTGIRPKITGPGTPAADFIIAGPGTHGVKNLIHLFGFESPGLTACLTIAQAVRAALDETPLDS